MEDNKETNILCIECGKRIKRDEGFIPGSYGKDAFHHPNCYNPLKSEKTRPYTSINTFKQIGWDDL